MRYYVEINGESSLDIQGLMIQSLPSISKPLMRSKQETIDGRDGDIVTKLGYSAYDKTLKIGLWGNYDINEVIAFFNQEGTITFSNEPDKYYRFTILNRDDYVSQLDKFRTCTIALHCQPYKYKLNEEAEELENEYVEQEGTSLTFNNTLVAPMNIDLKGNTLQNGTPTPSSPIPINNVSGDNDVVVQGKNLFNIQTIVKGRLDNGVLGYASDTSVLTLNENSFSFTTTANYRGATSDYIKVSEGNYVFNSNTANSTYGFNCACYDSNKSFINNANVSVESGGTKRTFTITSGITYVRFYFYLSNAGTLTIDKPMLEQGNQATTYEAYNGTTYNIDLPVENLFDKDTMVYNNKYYLPGDISSTQIRESNGIAGVLIVKLQEGNTYTISKRAGARFRFGFTDIATPVINTNNQIKSRLANNDSGTTTTFVVPNGQPYFVCNFFSDDQTLDAQIGYTNMLNSIQIEKGSKSNSYTPYGTTPIELNKIGTYQDYFYKENDKWYLHKEVGKVVLNGSEYGWFEASAINNHHRYVVPEYDAVADNITSCYSNYFKGVVRGSLLNNNEIAARDTGIQILTDTYTTLNDFKTWISNNNVIVDYVLNTPTNTEITYTPLIEQLESIKNAMSKEGTTNINQVNNDAPFIITASVLSGTDSITLTNEGNTTSKPTLTITGSGVVGVYLENIQMFNISLGTNETIIIDTENMEAYYGSQLKNRQVTGDYSNFALQSGTNNLKFTGVVTNVEITNYNRWI